MNRELFLPWKVVQNYRGRIVIVDSRNNGKDITSGRVCNLPQGDEGHGRYIAEMICETMNRRFTTG